MTLVCECGSSEIEIVDATYPEDADGRPTDTGHERYECQECGRTGSFAFGGGADERLCHHSGGPAMSTERVGGYPEVELPDDFGDSTCW